MQTVNEVRLAILENFMRDMSTALQDEDDPEDLRWRLIELEGTCHNALVAAMPQVGDQVVVARSFIEDPDNDTNYAVTMTGMAGAVDTLYKDGVVLRGSDYFASYDEVALHTRR